MSNIDSRIVLDLTYVEYTKDDPLSFILAIIALTPIFIIVGFTSIILFKRELHIIFFLIGQLLDVIFNRVLKKIVKEDRPDNSWADKQSSHGWPSNHTQFMWFFCIYVTLYLIIRARFEKGWKIFIIICTTVCAILVTYQRFTFELHTISQCVWGAIIGCCTGTCWFLFNNYIITPYIYPLLEDFWLCKYFYVKDSQPIGNILKFEYDNVKNIKRKKKKNK